MRYIKEAFASRELLANLVLREIRGKYKRTVFGQLWSLANPLALMLIYTFVFAFILRIKPEAGDPSGLDIFALWLLCGFLPWIFFATVLMQGVGSIVSNAPLVQKVYFPRILLPLSVVGSTGYNWLFEMGVLIVALSVFGAFVIPWVPLVIVIMILLAIFASGVALMLSIANVYFRDTEYFVGIALQLWMYLTPIIYPASAIETESAKLGGLLGTPITVADIYHLNPMEHFVNVFRQLLYDNRWPDLSEWLICVCWSAASLAVGIFVFRKNEKKLAEAL